MTLHYTAYTGKGSRQNQNEDRILVADRIAAHGTYSGTESGTLFAAVCDGVGGEAGGAAAAQLAAEDLRSVPDVCSSPVSVLRHIYRVNAEILRQQKEGFSRMATTAAGLLCYRERFIAFYIGDTRIYRTENGSVRQISSDHTVTENGRLRLSSYLGGSGGACQPAVRCGSFHANAEELLICTDGIYRAIPEAVLHGILLSGHTPAEKQHLLLKAAERCGSDDDRSLVLIRYENPSASSESSSGSPKETRRTSRNA